MNEQFHMVIVGAGIAGLTVAALLAQSRASERLKITLVDAQQRPSRPTAEDIALRVSAIATGSSHLLDKIGAWSCLDAGRIAPYDGMRVWDESSTAASGDALFFEAAEFAVPQLGFIVENVHLQAALLDVLQRESVELLFASPIATLQPQQPGVLVRLEDGRTLHADLVIGADGARSKVRESAEIESEEWVYGQSAFVTHLRPEKAHCNTAWQRFLSKGPLGMLPLYDGRISVVWSTNG